jgi:hypothetical protein
MPTAAEPSDARIDELFLELSLLIGTYEEESGLYTSSEECQGKMRLIVRQWLQGWRDANCG